MFFYRLQAAFTFIVLNVPRLREELSSGRRAVNNHNFPLSARFVLWTMEGKQINQSTNIKNLKIITTDFCELAISNNGLKTKKTPQN